ncbi:MAG TPA: inositol monophosphatase [Streptosporangiaceae bacterium]
MTHSAAIIAGSWKRQLDAARAAAKEAGKVIKGQFGYRVINRYKGQFDVQLNTDVLAQRKIYEVLQRAYPGYGFVGEEAPFAQWTDEELLWVVDPLDGTNNFGYGIAHCCISICLFRRDVIVLALVADPLMGREFSATCERELRNTIPIRAAGISMRKATISLVTNYSQSGRLWGNRIAAGIGAYCKRVTSLWAPALDLALISNGALDAMVCHEAGMLDVCAGIFLVQAEGGCIIGFDGEPYEISRATHDRPVSFIAARNRTLAKEIFTTIKDIEAP